MCGIFGYINFENDLSDIKRARAKAAQVLTLMSHRGPDGKGIISDVNWILAHTRLAVIDLRSGSQPWRDPETGMVMTYNGEIYNYIELREELIHKGFKFRSFSDTEVLMKSYIAWGEECLHKLNGMFAFSVIDPKNKILFAARDRLGIKPFFYYKTNNYFCFCSSIQGIKTLIENNSMEIDYESVSHYLTTGRPLFGERTLLKNIFQLRPGYKLRLNIETGDLIKGQFWQIPVIKEPDKADISLADAAKRVYSLINDSVKLRLRTDVSAGAFLSGGLDSSIITFAAERYMDDKPLPLFCAGTDYDDLNEFEYAEIMSNFLNERLTKVHIDANTFYADWTKLMEAKGLPLSTPNEISIYHLAKKLREKCTVTLTGEGADEIFGGYIQPHLSGYDFDRCPHSPEEDIKDSRFTMAMNILYGRDFFINDTDHYIATCSWFTFIDKADLFKPDFWEYLQKDESIFIFYENFFSQLEGCTSIEKRIYLHAVFNLENLLFRIDNSTMLASVEARVPFNDHRLVEFGFSLPEKYKIDWISEEAYEKGKEMTSMEIDKNFLVESKKVLRVAFRKYLPDKIIERKKMSFPVPFTEWFYGPIFNTVKEIIFDSKFVRTHFNMNAIENLITRKHRNIWLLANLAKWTG